jgi:hypothetical protein
MLLLRQLRDCSGLDIFIAGEAELWQLLLWEGKQDANCYVPKPDGMEDGPNFQNQAPSLLYCVCVRLGIIM